MSSNNQDQDQDQGNDKIFSMIFDGAIDEEEMTRRRRRHRKSTKNVIVPPSQRQLGTGRRKSRYYTRPVFKEPGSKVPPAPDKRGLHQNQKQQQQQQEMNGRTTHRVAIIHTLRGDVDKKLNEEVDAIQPSSRTRDRVKSIVGKKPALPYARMTVNRHAGLETRLLKKRSVRASPTYDFNDAESVATNIDKLAVKRLSERPAYALERQPSDLSTIRREVKKMVVETVMPRIQTPVNDPTQAMRSAKQQETLSAAIKQEDARDEASESVPLGDGREKSVEETGLQPVAASGLMSIWCEAPALQSILSDVSSWKMF